MPWLGELCRLVSLPFLSVALAGCSPSGNKEQFDDRPTPTKYVVCSPGYTDCFLVARFADRSTCERYKEINGKLCDSISFPGKTVCTDPTTTSAEAYCTE